jgi:rod shape determining protein RodA
VTAVPYGRDVAVGSRRERKSILSNLRHVDFVLVGCALALALLGIVMVYTATRPALELAKVNPHYYMERQFIWVVIGIVVMVVVASIDYRRFNELAYVLYGLILLSLVGVFVVGQSNYGAERWYALGPLQLQPSEFAALALILAIASYCSRRQGVLAFRQMLGLLLLAGLPMLLVYKQPDLGTTIVLGVTLTAMMLAADVRLRYLAVLFVGVVGGFFLAIHLHLLQAYQLDRLTGFLHQYQHCASTNYDLCMARDAISSGGLHGSGIGQGAATNLSLVPNQQNDFIFSAIGEQLGFVGSAIVIGLFGLMAMRMLRAAQLAKDTFGRLVCAGALAFTAFSAFENIGMTIGIMPITGIPLPFISYGGSASFAFFATIGLVLSVEMRRVVRR